MAMDGAQLSRWTRFAAKGGIGKCTATQDCVAKHPEDLMFLKDDEITVLMQFTDQKDTYLGYCEGVVGRFEGAYVHFHSKLKTPVMTKRASSSSKSPRSSIASQRHISSQSPVPPIQSPAPPPAPTPLPDDSASLRALVNSPTPSVPKRQSFIAPDDLVVVPNEPPVAAGPSQPPDASPAPDAPPAANEPPPAPEAAPVAPPEPEYVDEPIEATPPMVHEHHMTASISYSSASSVQDSMSPRTPGDFPSEITPRGETSMLRPPVLSGHWEGLGVRTSVAPYYPPEITDSPVMSVDKTLDDSASGRISVAMSDGVVGIGLSLLQDFISGGDGDDASSTGSRSDLHTRDSLDDTIEGIPVPSAAEHEHPHELEQEHDHEHEQTPAERATEASLIGSASPSSQRQSESEFGSEWEGASDIYDNYRYSRMSLASKMSRMSKSSTYTSAHVPPPIPGDFRPSIDRAYSSDAHSRRSLESHYSAQVASPVLPAEEPPAAVVAAQVQAQVQAQPQLQPPVVAEKMRPEPLELVGSPLLHTTFGSPQTSPALNTGSTTSYISAASGDSGMNGAASALRQRLELERDPGTTQSGIVVDENQHLSQSRSAELEREHQREGPTLTSSSSYPPEKKRGMPPQLHVANPAPPPPYTPMSPPAFPPQPQASSSSAPFNAMPEPHIPPLVTRRPERAGPGPGPESRTSLFMPHPNAPKPTSSSAGPLYGRKTAGMAPSGLIRTLQMASAARFGPNGRPRLTTIFGVMDQDLLMSLGPVPISFSLEPPNNVPARMPKRMATVATTRLVNGMEEQVPVPLPEGAQQQQHPPHQQHLPPPQQQQQQQETPVKAIPRPNFFPKAPKERPRSRSFSGFDSQLIDPSLSKERSQEEPSETAKKVDPSGGARPLSASKNPRLGNMQKQYAPSPLAISLTAPLPSPSPVTPIPTSPHSVREAPRSPLAANTPITPTMSTPPAQSQSHPQPPPSPNAAQQQHEPRSASSDPVTDSPSVASPHSPMSPQSAHSELPALSANRRHGTGQPADAPPHARESLRRQTSVDTDVSNQSDARSAMASPPPPRSGSPASGIMSPLARNTSLRSKISLSALRARASHQNSRDDAGSVVNEAREHETVQVEDMDFELVKPSFPASRASEDSSFHGSAAGHDIGNGKPELSSFLRAESPAVSTMSGAASMSMSMTASMPRSPTSLSESMPPPSLAKPGDVEAHRHRELKWINTMATIPAAQARKSKRVKKLLQEGVPASVRYQVWAHLTDSKGKRIDGLYGQLGKRGKVPASDEIARDARECFPDQPQLVEADGPIVSLLQAYLTMVPDIQYHRELVLIAGRLLLQSPEEDAFWIFISLMDTYLRPYFAVSTIQMEVDAQLWGKALEANDPSVARKLFVELAITPTRVCRPWFAGMFVEALPTEYFLRVWDIFLSEGVVFLFRVGLALVTCCRRALLECTTTDRALELLLRPPGLLLSSNPDTLIELAGSAKLKDDDVRKQRTKLEAQVKKRQTQGRALTPSGGKTSSRGPSISLPRS
ncbi:hypothetical protein DENSPDRAFT_843281 [Dentipellis sp. KUC8613]|nr:hypothetical protein DENSPDRAFT_843281 [Dentipellis sp. KUC8613]